MFLCVCSLLCQNRWDHPELTRRSRSTKTYLWILHVCVCCLERRHTERVPSVHRRIDVTEANNCSPPVCLIIDERGCWWLFQLKRTESDPDNILWLERTAFTQFDFYVRFSIRLLIKAPTRGTSFCSLESALLLDPGRVALVSVITFPANSKRSTAVQLYLHISCCCYYRETFYLQNEFVLFFDFILFFPVYL